MLDLTEERGFAPTGDMSESISRVALVGFMGAGKTTVGQALAQRLGWRFADLDQLVEDLEKRTIPQIFSDEGEARFRELECEVLQETLSTGESHFLVLALGGGAFVNGEIRDLLHARDVPSVWLDASPEELFRRCDQPGVVRPLRRDPRQFAELHEQRLSLYRQADLHVVTNGKEVSSIAEEVIQRLALAPASRSSQ